MLLIKTARDSNIFYRFLLTKAGSNYDRYPGRVWTFMENITGTAFDFALVLRQMYTETILREKLQTVGAAYYPATECVDYEIDPDAGNNYPVTVTRIDHRTQSNIILKG